MLNVFQNLIDYGVTVIFNEHDLDLISNADYIVDNIGIKSHNLGGNILVEGILKGIIMNVSCLTEKYLNEAIKI